MSDRDTATVDLSRAEARVVIAALSDEETTAAGERERAVRDIEEHLAREFDFDEYRGVDEGEMAADDDEGWLDNDIIFDDDDPDDTEAVELSRREADTVTDALGDFDAGAAEENRETAEDVRERIADSFDGDNR